MPKLAVASLLIVVGLGLGLWLGFDPQARAAVEVGWSQANDSLVEVQDSPRLKIESAGADSADQRLEPSLWIQISEGLSGFWQSAQQLMFSLTARLKVAQ